MEKKKEFKDVLRQARLRKDLTQVEVAKKLLVGVSTVRSWEAGTRYPSTHYRKQLSELLELNTQEPAAETGDLSDIHISSSEGQEVAHRDHQIKSDRTISSSKENENRSKMLKRVRSRWISGALDPLSTIPLINVSLQWLPEAVANPWRLDTLDPSPIPFVSLDTPIIDIYDSADGEILLLGEPGAGKTTLLLQLTKNLIERARHDTAHPIPVIFHLASWSDTQPHFVDWLQQELHTTYQIPLQLAKKWLMDDGILLLLDGLDEVDQRLRVACIQAINEYRQDHGLVPLVVCSRTDDYMTLSERVILENAVIVQPLTMQQIMTYLTNGGPNLEAAKLAIQDDEALQEMVTTPLILRMIAFTYYKISVEEVQAMRSSNERYHALFQHYVKRLLTRKTTQTESQNSAQEAKTMAYLEWLAQKMQQHNQTEFYIERVQPDWLDEHTQRAYRYSIIRIVFGLSLFTDAALFGCFRGDSVPNQPGLFYWLGGKGYGTSILGWMAPGLGGIHTPGISGSGSLGLLTFVVELLVVLIVSQKAIPVISKGILYHAFRHTLRRSLALGTVFAGLCGIVYSITDNLWYGLYRFITLEPYAISVLWVMLGITQMLRHPHIGRLETKNPHPQIQKESLTQRIMHRFINFFIFSICGTCGLGGVYALESGGITHLVLVNGLIIGVGLGSIFELDNMTSLAKELGTTIRPAEIVSWSWQHVRENIPTHLKQGLLLGWTIALLIFIFLVSIGCIFNGFDYALRYALTYGPIIGVVTSITGFLTGTLQSGWTSTMIEDEHKFVRPNQGIRNSLRHACFAASLFGSVGGLVGGLINGFAFRLAGVPGWLTLLYGFTLIYSIMFAFRAWLAYGGFAVIEHYVLRWYLQRAHVIPWNYVKFLDDVSNLLILRKIGGGYMFTHKLLQDYFASNTTPLLSPKMERKKHT